MGFLCDYHSLAGENDSCPRCAVDDEALYCAPADSADPAPAAKANGARESVEFEACNDPSCPTRGRHAHPVGGRSAEYWLARLQRHMREAEAAQAQVQKAASELVLARTRGN